MTKKRESIGQSNWYLLYTFPNYEKKVFRISSQKNIPCYLPTHKIVRQWRDRKKILDVPLFPNYLFVYTTSKERYRLLDIPGASKFVSFEGKPVVLMEEAIETIKKITSTQNVEIEQHCIGDRVRIDEGVFTGLEGTLVRKSGAARLAIRVEGVNQVISIALDGLSITKI